MANQEKFGISPALATPFRSDCYVDDRRLLAHAGDLLKRGCQSVTAFGTTGEGPSVSLAERHRTIDALIAGGFAPVQIVSGVIGCSPQEAVEGLAFAVRRRLKATLLAPPFYFRGVNDDALFAWFSHVIGSAGKKARGIILYHIPSMTGVPLSSQLIGRLKQAFPGAIHGVKDSSGDKSNTFALLKAHGDLHILSGDERYLGAACAAGASGSICGMANLLPERMCAIVREGRDDPVVQALVEAIVALPVIPAVKAAVGHARKDPAWLATCPPLAPLNAAQVKRLAKAVDRAVRA